MDFYKRLAPVVDKPSPCAGATRSTLPVRGGAVYTHIAQPRPIDVLVDNIGGGGKATFGGKPGGFWFTKDRIWVDLLTRKGQWKVTAELLGTPGQRPRPYISDAYACVIEGKCKAFEEGMPLQSSVSSDPHFVYRFSLDDAFVSDIHSPDRQKVFYLDSSNEAEFSSYFNRWMQSVSRAKVGVVREFLAERGLRDMSEPRTSRMVRNRLLADFYSEDMAPKWGGIYFDGSIFAGPIQPESWKVYLEVESGCLWHPLSVMGLPEPACVAPNAVIALAGSKEEADRLGSGLAPYADRLFVVGVDTGDSAVFFRQGVLQTGGRRRGRTFRRKPLRKNKNGRRLARQSQRRLRNRNA